MQEDLGKWKCNVCEDTDGVTNGICPNDGPVQTTPIDEVAEKIAGVPEAAEAKKKAEEEKLKAEEEAKVNVKDKVNP